LFCLPGGKWAVGMEAEHLVPPADVYRK
jgi:hypothetical protein